MSIFKKTKVALDLQSIAILIGEGCTVNGDFKAPLHARVDGQITGDVIVDEGLILGEKGTIHGNVTTKEMLVYGIVNGDITVSSLEIKASGKVTGKIKTQTLTVENGAVYNGSLTMTTDAKPVVIAKKEKQQLIEA